MRAPSVAKLRQAVKSGFLSPPPPAPVITSMLASAPFQLRSRAWVALTLGIFSIFGCGVGQVGGGGVNGSVGGSDSGSVGVGVGVGSSVIGSPPGLAMVVDDGPSKLPGVAATVSDGPSAPLGANGETLNWTTAPEMLGVWVQADRDSAILTVPTVAGAQDYRVLVLAAGLQVAGVDTRESLSGATIFCAGRRQYNAPLPTTVEVMRQVEVLGLSAPQRLVIEAIDQPCPFVGLLGAKTYNTRAVDPSLASADRVPFGLQTEAELRSAYRGSLILNGQGPGAKLAAPAAWLPPRVLARTTVMVTPQGTLTPRLAYYDDFANSADVPMWVADGNTYDDRNSNGVVLQNSRWSFYAYNYDRVDFQPARGALNITLLDRYQEVFASVFMTPRRAVQVHTSSYLHASYTVASNSSQRRYPWLFLCGPEAGGHSAFDERGLLTQDIVQTAFFYSDDGRNPSLAGYNCLQLFSRDGLPFSLGPTQARPQADLRVMLNRANAAPRASVVNVSPDQYRSHGRPGQPTPSWYLQQDAADTLGAPILDDQMLLSPRSRYDVYISRSRIIVYINGSQRLCNDFPSLPLTMSEGILGFGQVLYHSAAERSEFISPTDDRSGQVYFRKNTPYADVRTWDGVGFQEAVVAPADFDVSRCFVYGG